MNNKKIFTVDDHITIVCEWKKTRSAFKHVATLFVDGQERDEVKICYQNRTWESFEFESVLQKLLEKTDAIQLTDTERADFFKRASGEANDETLSGFKRVAAIAQLGEIFGRSTEERNAWKARILKAGLGHLGLDIPSDWNQLDEAQKETRLNAVIDQLGKTNKN